jgi:hypothetical protein
MIDIFCQDLHEVSPVQRIIWVRALSTGHNEPGFLPRGREHSSGKHDKKTKRNQNSVLDRYVL